MILSGFYSHMRLDTLLGHTWLWIYLTLPSSKKSMGDSKVDLEKTPKQRCVRDAGVIVTALPGRADGRITLPQGERRPTPYLSYTRTSNG